MYILIKRVSVPSLEIFEFIKKLFSLWNLIYLCRVLVGYIIALYVKEMYLNAYAGGFIYTMLWATTSEDAWILKICMYKIAYGHENKLAIPSFVVRTSCRFLFLMLIKPQDYLTHKRISDVGYNFPLTFTFLSQQKKGFPTV